MLNYDVVPLKKTKEHRGQEFNTGLLKREDFQEEMLLLPSSERL